MHRPTGRSPSTRRCSLGCTPPNTGRTPKALRSTLRRTRSPNVSRGGGYRVRGFSANGFVSPDFGFDKGFDRLTGTVGLRLARDGEFDWNAFIGAHEAYGFARYFRAVAAAARSDAPFLRSLRQGVELKFQDLGWYPYVDSGATLARRSIDSMSFGDDEFLFVNLMESHGPYTDIPDEHRSDLRYEPPGTIGCNMVADPPGDPDTIKRAYDDAARYLSSQYEKFFESLQAEMDIVITLADHGELLGDAGLWGHEYGLRPELVHVPLVVSGLQMDGTVDEVVSTLDVYATVLELAGLDPDGDRRSRSLLGEVDGRPVLTEYHGLPVGRVEALAAKDVPVEEYDVEQRGVATADEYSYEDGTRDVPPDHDDAVASVTETFVEFERTSDDRQVTESTRRRLKEFGYA